MCSSTGDSAKCHPALARSDYPSFSSPVIQVCATTIPTTDDGKSKGCTNGVTFCVGILCGLLVASESRTFARLSNQNK
jgi:hypothetical protein